MRLLGEGTAVPSAKILRLESSYEANLRALESVFQFHGILVPADSGESSLLGQFPQMAWDDLSVERRLALLQIGRLDSGLKVVGPCLASIVGDFNSEGGVGEGMHGRQHEGKCGAGQDFCWDVLSAHGRWTI